MPVPEVPFVAALGLLKGLVTAVGAAKLKPEPVAPLPKDGKDALGVPLPFIDAPFVGGKLLAGVPNNPPVCACPPKPPNVVDCAGCWTGCAPRLNAGDGEERPVEPTRAAAPGLRPFADLIL